MIDPSDEAFQCAPFTSGMFEAVAECDRLACNSGGPMGK